MDPMGYAFVIDANYTPSLVLRLSGHMEWRSGHVWTKIHIAWWKAVLGHGYALRLCQQWRQREGLTAFDSWNPGFSRVLTSSECQRYLCIAAKGLILTNAGRPARESGVSCLDPCCLFSHRPWGHTHHSLCAKTRSCLLMMAEAFFSDIAVTFFVFSLDSNMFLLFQAIECDVTKKHLHSHRTEETRVCGRMVSAWGFRFVYKISRYLLQSSGYPLWLLAPIATFRFGLKTARSFTSRTGVLFGTDMILN